MEQQYSPTGFSFLPPVVKNLLIINGLFFLATISMGTSFGLDLTEILGLHYFSSDEFRPYQFVTYMFVHANLGHVFFNMFALWMFGYLVENVWGSKRFLTYYMVTGIGAGLVQMVVQYFSYTDINAAVAIYNANPGLENFTNFLYQYKPHTQELLQNLQKFYTQWVHDPDNLRLAEMSKEYIEAVYQQNVGVATVGASGAVYGILLAFGMLFPNMLVYIYFLFPIRAKYLVLIFGALELFYAVANNPNDNVAHFAHLGGMIFGFFLIIYWKKRMFRH